MKSEALPLDATEPVVGWHYQVPCLLARMPRVQGGGHVEVVLPFIGGPAADPEIDNPIIHYHVDSRFVSDDQWRSVFGGNFSPNTIRVITEDKVVKLLGLSRKLCSRRLPLRLANVGFIDKLEEHVRGRKVIVKDGCLYCPHKGFPLGGARRLPGCPEVAECQGHALTWNTVTGELVPHAERKLVE